MATTSETSDQALLDLLRRSGPMTVSEMSISTEVTPNAVRQRLARLMAQDLVDRKIERTGQPGKQRRERGRPTHCYFLTEKARRQAGDNFADLAMAL